MDSDKIAALAALLVPALAGVFMLARPELTKQYYESHRPIFGRAYPRYSILGIRLAGVLAIIVAIGMAALTLFFR